jgi:hypothetical protein
VNHWRVAAGLISLCFGAAVAPVQTQSVELSPLLQIVAVRTTTDPTAGGTGGSEIRLVQPLLGGQVRLLHGHLHFAATLNLEGVVIPQGELALGNWGEGLIDRRHPHTYAHELMAAAVIGHGAAFQAGIAIGKGFVPFGSDDPMSRPPLRYPVNHHWAQILERAVVMAQLKWSKVVVEAALFNGDEPERPGQWPNLSRFGDSWSLRLIAAPWTWLDLQVSRAHLHSPEHRPGAGLDQEKQSLSARAERSVGSTFALYTLAEWARTTEFSGLLAFASLLGETAVRRGRQSLYYRFERTERPEEIRLEPSRSIRPHRENDVLGISRWTTHTAGYRVGLAPAGAKWSFEPFAEGTLGTITKVGGGFFAVSDWYQRDRFWSVSVGTRAGFGLRGHRMGRYGVLADLPAGAPHH